MSLFLRLLGEEDKGAGLLEAVRTVAAGEADPRVFEVDPTSFEQVPGAPFAYWVNNRVREVFRELSPIESQGRTAKVGLMTQDDFRYIRVWTEVSGTLGGVHNKWFGLNKGGVSASYYGDIPLMLEWARSGRTLRAHHIQRFGSSSKYIFSDQYYGKAAITYTQRTQSGFAGRVMPAGLVFTHKGPAIIAKSEQENLSLLAVCNSISFRLLLSIQMAFGSYEVGVIQRTPVPDLSAEDTERLAGLARRAWSLKRGLDTATLTSHAFVLPALLQAEGGNLDARAAAWSERVRQTDLALAEIQSEIDARCFDLYGFDEADRAAAMGEGSLSESGLPEDAGTEDSDEDVGAGSSADPKALFAELFDWLVGLAFGRFDLRFATCERAAPPEPDPFDPLPICSPGMLTGEDGLPLAEAPPDYPLACPADGILADDADEAQGAAGSDLLPRIRLILGILAAQMDSGANSGCATETLEADLCRLLGVKSLRDWLRRPAGFFADHLGRWSKSRRKAPIYWPLSTASGGYTLWIYYPRLTDQTLYTCVNDHIDPKLKEIGADLERLRSNGDMDAKARKRADALLELQREIQALREELLRVARLPYKPDQNDGVLITAAPLWRLFRHKPWQKELAKCWDTLEAGGYDWAHLALALWPQRVRELCKTDRSVAIAHGLDDQDGG